MPKSLQHRLPSLCSCARMAAVALLAAAPDARASPAPEADPGGLTVSASAQCRVALAKVSYDDPGADDAELLELRVTSIDVAGFAPAAPDAATGTTCGSGTSGHPATGAGDASRGDAGQHIADGADGGARVLTLGSCGLRELQLVDGNGGGCATYRTIPLADVPVSADGWVTVCRAGSVPDANHGCDVSSAGRSSLRDGWLQNGPNDGLRFVGVDGAALVEVAYEGGPACFSSSAVTLVDESGQVAGSDPAVPEDDVNAFCGGHFVLLSERDAPLRAPAACPVLRGADGGGPADATSTTAPADAAPADAAWVPERAPATASRSKLGSVGTGYLDAGAPPTRTAAQPPMPPGCDVSGGRVAVAPRAGMLVPFALALAGVLTRRRRTTRGPAAPRAGSSARCGSSPRR